MRIEQWKNGALVSFQELPETPDEIKARIGDDALSVLPEILLYIAGQNDAPQALKDKAAKIAADKLKL